MTYRDLITTLFVEQRLHLDSSSLDSIIEELLDRTGFYLEESLTKPSSFCHMRQVLKPSKTVTRVKMMQDSEEVNSAIFNSQ